MDNAFYETLPLFFGKVKKNFQRQVVENMKGYDVNAAEIFYLTAISDKSGITPKELTESVDFDKAYTTRIIKELSGKGYIVCNKPENKSRRYKIFLTDSGAEIVEHIKKHSETARDCLFSILTEEECETMSEIFEKLSRSLDI